MVSTVSDLLNQCNVKYNCGLFVKEGKEALQYLTHLIFVFIKVIPLTG